MKKILLSIFIMFSLIFVYADSNHDDHASKSSAITESKVQTRCPVMGGVINKELYVDHDGKRIYVCCQMCINKVKSDPDNYLSKMENDGIELEDILD